MGLILGIAGAAISAVGTIGSGIAAGNAAAYQAQIARNNAIVANQNAAHASAAGAQQEETESLKGAANIGGIKAAQAANGVDVNSGSALDVQESAREENQLTSENVLNNAELTAYGYRTQAASDTAQAALDQTEAEEAPIGAGIAATGGLLSSASSLSFKWAGTGSGGSGSDLSGTDWSGVG